MHRVIIAQAGTHSFRIAEGYFGRRLTTMTDEQSSSFACLIAKPKTVFRSVHPRFHVRRQAFFAEPQKLKTKTPMP